MEPDYPSESSPLYNNKKKKKPNQIKRQVKERKKQIE